MMSGFTRSKVKLKHWGMLGIVGSGFGLLAIHIASNPSANPHFTGDSPKIHALALEKLPQPSTSVWVISPEQAQNLIQQGATVLDVRPRPWTIRRIPGAVTVRWQDFSPTPSAQRGHLLADDERLTQQIQALGISQETPVVVIGDPIHGWGEEGRIVWMLRTLGHLDAFMVNGGHQAVQALGIPSTRGNASSQPGNFMVQRNPAWSVGKDELKAGLWDGDFLVIDAREAREYDGATPYGETRGGHIPGAIHLYYRELLDEAGYLLPKSQVLALLKTKGIGTDQPLVVYCTGGVRSAWLTAVLSDFGFQARNYAGSMWEWSAHPAEQYPLEKTQSEKAE